MSDGLLLVHAFPVDHRMWRPQADALAGSGIPVVAPDLPGFGGSHAAGAVMSMAAAAARCVEALDEAGIERAVVCGLSMGGYVAFELWRSASERIIGLLLANTKAEDDTDEAREGRRGLAARLRDEGSGFLVEAPPKLLSASASPEVRAAVHEMLADQPAESIAAASLGMAERPDSRPDLASISAPTLVVTSDGDGLIPPEITAAMAPEIPGAELLELPGAGHLSNLEAPDGFTEGLRGLLRRAGLTAG